MLGELLLKRGSMPSDVSNWSLHCLLRSLLLHILHSRILPIGWGLPSLPPDSQLSCLFLRHRLHELRSRILSGKRDMYCLRFRLCFLRRFHQLRYMCHWLLSPQYNSSRMRSLHFSLLDLHQLDGLYELRQWIRARWLHLSSHV